MSHSMSRLDQSEGRKQSGYRCPYCRVRAIPMRYTKVSTGGWVVFTLLLLSCLLSLFCWIGLLIREEYRKCPNCGVRIS